MASLLLLVMMISPGWAQDCNKPNNLQVKLHNQTWYDALLTWDAPDVDTRPYTSSNPVQVFNNGPYTNYKGVGPDGGNVNAPLSSLDQYIGFNVNERSGFGPLYAMDDFILTQEVALKYVDVFCFLHTKLPSDTACIQSVKVAIFAENPRLNRDAKPIWGVFLKEHDTILNPPMEVEFTGDYATPNENFSSRERPIFRIRAKLDTTLPAGQYWFTYTTFSGCGGFNLYTPPVRSTSLGSTGDAWAALGLSAEMPFESSNHAYTFGLPFNLYGIPSQNLVTGYEILRNGESIYKETGIFSSYAESLQDTAMDYTYEVKAVWLDSCVSASASKTVKMEENPCRSVFSFDEITQDFEDSNFLAPGRSCWSLKLSGPTVYTHHFITESERQDTMANFHRRGNGILTYNTSTTLYRTHDTCFLTSPKFKSNGKKMIVSFWLYRPFKYFGNEEHVIAYCLPAGQQIDSTITPNAFIYRSTTRTPEVAVAGHSGWYQHSFVVDGSQWQDSAYQLTLVLTVANKGGGMNLSIDDIKIEEAGIPDGSCQRPTSPQVKYDENEAQLAWRAPGVFPFGSEGELNYARGIEPSHAFGWTGGSYSIMLATRFDTTDLKNLGVIEGSKLMAISFVPTYTKASVDNFVLKIWQGGKATNNAYSPGKLIYDQPVDKSQLKALEWNKVDLEVPLEIDLTKELWFGIGCDVRANALGGPIISDNSYAVLDKGDLLFASDIQQWTTASILTAQGGSPFQFNWCIKASVNIPNPLSMVTPMIEDPTTEVEEYVIYRDGGELARVSGLTYTDNTIQAGKTDYEYAVSAHYNTDCNSPKAPVTLYVPTSIRGEEKNITDVFGIYPNPAKNVLYIRGENIKKVALYNQIGQLVETKTVDCHQINTASYKNGLYVVRVTDKKGYTETKQIVIMH